MEKTYWTVTILNELRMMTMAEEIEDIIYGKPAKQYPFESKEEAYAFSEKLKAKKIANYINKVTKVG